MADRVLITSLLLVMFTSLQAQDQAIIRLGPALGYRHFSASISGDIGGGLTSTRSASGLMPTISISAGAQIPITAAISLRADVSALWSQSTLSDRFTVPVVVGQDLGTGTIRRDNNITTSMIGADLGLLWSPADRVHLSLSAGMVFPPSFSVAVSDQFEQPVGATFVSSGSSLRQFEAALLADGPARSYGTITVQAARAYPLNAEFSLAPYIYGSIAFTSALANGGWYPWQLGIGVDVCISFPTASPISPHSQQELAEPVEPIVLQRVRSDTATIVDAFRVGRVDTVWRSTEEVRSDTVSGPGGDTVLVHILEHVERHIPGPPPFLSIILDVVADNDAVDTLAAVRVFVECVGDTSSSSVVTIQTEDAVIWSELFTTPRLERTIVLSSVIPEISERSTIVLNVTATTTDAVGQTREAVPRRITLRRTRSGSTLQGVR